ncbi:hypothetical protein BGZ60DRAFT_473941 [Tricladium varicosporioides]|nr:hypothetical protein BGZ60DRAFT_473941 [Hymenoscyphus varicosporioides]
MYNCNLSLSSLLHEYQDLPLTCATSRIAYFDKSGMCIIGMELKVLMPLIIFDACINKADSRLKTVALRSFIGSCGTLASSIVNLTVLMVLKGEAAWICLMCCNADILFSVLMLHWVTSKDSTVSSSAHSNSDNVVPKSNSFKNRISKFAGCRGKQAENTEWEWQMGVMTTKIEAGSIKDGEEMDKYNEDNKNRINVKVDHSVVVTRDIGSHIQPPSPRSAYTPKSEFEEAGNMGIGHGLGKSAAHVSTEDLVKKDVSFLT